MNRDYPLISIIVPNYNRIDYLEECIESVLNQSYQNWELIIVDDGSETASLEIIKKYSERNEKVKFRKRKRLPKGANVCRNIGIDMAEGKYIMFLDSDDLLTKECLENRIKFIEKYPDYDFHVFSALQFDDRTGEELAFFYHRELETDNIAAFLLRPQWSTSGSIIELKKIKGQILFDEKLSRWQDWDFHIRVLSYYTKVKRNDIKKYDVLKRIHNEVDRISAKTSTIDNTDVESLISLLKIYKLDLIKGELQYQAFQVRVFKLAELCIRRHRLDKVEEVLRLLENESLPTLYKFLWQFYSLSGFLKNEYFWKKLFFIANNYVQKIIINKSKSNIDA